MRNNQDKIPSAIRLTLFFALAFILFGTLLIGSFIFIKTLQYLTGATISDTASLFNVLDHEPHAHSYLLMAQGLTAFISYVVIPMIVIIFVWPDLKDIFKIKDPHFDISLVQAILITLVSIPIIAFLSEWNKSLLQLPESFKSLQQWMAHAEKDAEKLTVILAYYSGFKEFSGGLLVIAVLPAIGEELLFRGILQKQLMKILVNPHLAILVTGFLFSFIHFQFFGFIPRMFLGVLFGYLFYWSGTIWIPMAMHFINNAVTYLALNFYKQRAISIDLESTKDLSPLLFLTSAALCIFLLFIFRKRITNAKIKMD